MTVSNEGNETLSTAEIVDLMDSLFEPPQPASGSPLLNQTLADESRAFANNEDQDKEQERRQKRELHGMRISHTWLLLALALVWIFVILVVVLLQGFGRWFTPFPNGFHHIQFKLSDTVIVAFITSTTATVLGLYGIAAYWLYGKPKKPEEPDHPKKARKKSR